MNLYERFVGPRLVEAACSARPISIQRAKVVPRAAGVVLEIGFGAGQNLPFYDAGRVERLYALEPSLAMRKRARRRLSEIAIPIEFLDLPGEAIPLDSASIDTVVVTYTLCTIPDVLTALEGMRRVLRPDGVLLFTEHGRAPDSGVRTWQDRLNQPWGKIAGGCHLNRNIPELIRSSGFAFDELEAMYLPGTPKFAGYNYWGRARAAR